MTTNLLPLSKPSAAGSTFSGSGWTSDAEIVPLATISMPTPLLLSPRPVSVLLSLFALPSEVELSTLGVSVGPVSVTVLDPVKILVEIIVAPPSVVVVAVGGGGAEVKLEDPVPLSMLLLLLLSSGSHSVVATSVPFETSVN